MREKHMQVARAKVHLVRPLQRLVLGSMRLAYRGFFISMLRDGSWQEPLVDMISPRARDRILDFGPGSAFTAVSLAGRFPAANFVVADPDPRALDRAQRVIARRQIVNITTIEAPPRARFPFSAGSFDKAVCLLTFHHHSFDEKVAIAREALRVLRRGGGFYVADYDRPSNRRERIVLGVAAHVSGKSAVQSHIDGSWGQSLKNAGFACLRVRAFHSVQIGRVVMLTAKKP